jgi:uncharacterized protein (DUF302 family)
MSYYISKTIASGFKQAMNQVVESLKTEGFGVISEIDIQQKLKEKLDIDFRRYIILGACNPSNAFQALELEDKIGTMLPCNVIVQEIGENIIEVAAVDPAASMMAVHNQELNDIAIEIRDKLERAIRSIT